MITKKDKKRNNFYGTTTLGERGQVVIPAQAREDFKLKKGEKLLVFGIGRNMIVLVKVEQAKKFADHLSKKLKLINSILKKII